MGGEVFEGKLFRRRQVQEEGVRGNGAIGALNHASDADEGNIAACNRGAGGQARKEVEREAETKGRRVSKM